MMQLQRSMTWKVGFLHPKNVHSLSPAQLVLTTSPEEWKFDTDKRRLCNFSSSALLISRNTVVSVIVSLSLDLMSAFGRYV